MLFAPQDQSGRVQKISPAQRFDPLTAQAVACRYAVYAIPAPLQKKRSKKQASKQTASSNANFLKTLSLLPLNLDLI
jgi:hypothetical protein